MRHTRNRYDRICNDVTVPWEVSRHALPDEYPNDTVLPFDVAMFAARETVATPQYQREGRMVRPRPRARRAPRVPVERRRRSVGLAVAELLPAALVILLALYAVVRILAGTAP